MNPYLVDICTGSKKFFEGTEFLSFETFDINKQMAPQLFAYFGNGSQEISNMSLSEIKRVRCKMKQR